MLLFVLTERFETANPRSFARASLFPLAIYYAVTLGIPLLNGSYHRGTAFWEHSAFVLVLPLLVILPLVLFFLAKSNKKFQPVGSWSLLKLPEIYDTNTAYPPRCSVVVTDLRSAGTGPGTTMHATFDAADRDRTKHLY
jgi:hypothetical protein